MVKAVHVCMFPTYGALQVNTLNLGSAGVLHSICFSYLLLNVRVTAQFLAGVPFSTMWTIQLLRG